MYRLITDHSKRYQVDVKGNQTFRQFLKPILSIHSKLYLAKNLTDFNQHLLDTQLNYYRDFISKIIICQMSLLKTI